MRTGRLYSLEGTGKQTQLEDTMMNGHMTMKMRNYRRWERSRAYQKKRAYGYRQRLQAKLLKAQEATEKEQPSLPLLESERISPNSAYAEQKSTAFETSSETTTELKA